MLRLAVLTMLVSVASGARSWITLVDPQVFVVDDIGRSTNALMEGDPLFTRSTIRPTSSPTITPEPTSFPTFPFPTKSPSDAPSSEPTVEQSSYPTISAEPTASVVPTVSFEPTMTVKPTTKEPTYVPGTAPTSNPTARTEHENGNGGCPVAEDLYEVVMYGKWGDGWDGRDLTIMRLGDDLVSETIESEKIENSHYLLTRTTVYSNEAYTVAVIKYNNSTSPAKTELINETHYEGFELSPNPTFKETIIEGDVQIRFACLQPGRCYRATIEGGAWSEEISWKVRKAQFDNTIKTPREEVVNGAAPSNCRFSVLGQGQDIQDMFCANECHIPGEIPLLTFPPSQYITFAPTRSPIQSDTLPTGKLSDLLAPSVSMTPSSAPTTIAPTTVPSLVPSRAPSLIPSRITNVPSQSSDIPTIAHSSSPTLEPSSAPSTLDPSSSPSTPEPSAVPSTPTSSPTAAPTKSPTLNPSFLPSLAPDPVPTIEPTWSPTTSPTNTPSDTLIDQPVAAPVAFNAPIDGSNGTPVAAPIALDPPVGNSVGTPVDPLIEISGSSPIAPVGRHNAPIGERLRSDVPPDTPVAPPILPPTQPFVHDGQWPTALSPEAPTTWSPIAPTDWTPSNWGGPSSPSSWNASPGSWVWTPAMSPSYSWPSSPAHPSSGFWPVAAGNSDRGDDGTAGEVTHPPPDEDKAESRHDNDDLLDDRSSH